MKIQCKEKLIYLKLTYLLIYLKLTLTNLATNSTLSPSLNHLICGLGSAYTSQLKFVFDAMGIFFTLGGSPFFHLGATGKKHC